MTHRALDIHAHVRTRARRTSHAAPTADADRPGLLGIDRAPFQRLQGDAP